MGKELVLTNWQVPRDPAMARFDVLKQVAPIDMRRYENVGSVEHHDSVQSVAEKMIAKQEAARGVKIDKEPQKGPTVNLGGIVDNRKDKVYFKLGTKQ